MPIVAESEYNPAGGRASIVQPEENPWKPPPDGGDVLAAAFRQVNPVASTIDVLTSSRPDLTPDPTYKPFDDPGIKGTKYENSHASAFIGSPNEAYSKWLRDRIDREDKDREMLASSGGFGVAATLAAGLVDPFNWIPMIGMAAKGAEGANFLRNAGKYAAYGAVTAAGSETVRQGTQVSRPMSESLSSVSSAALLMGLLGGAAGKFMRPKERAAIQRDIEDVTGVPRETPDAPTGGTGMPQSGGAAATDARTLRPVSIGIDQLPALAEKVRDVPYVGGILFDSARFVSDRFTGTSPTMRTFFQDTSLTARRAMADMAETALRFTDNTIGIPTTYNGAISRIVRNDQVRMQMKGQEIVQDLWNQHYYGADVPNMPVARSNMDRLLGNAPAGKLSLPDFKAEVSKAAYSGDLHSNPQVQQAAQMIRKEILEPVRKAFIEAGIATEDMIKPKGDLSFWPRIHNKQAIAERRNEYVKIRADFLEQEQTIKAAAKERLQALADDHAGHVSDIQMLERRLEAIENRAGQTGVRLSERAMEARKADARLATTEGRLADVQQSISELEEFLADLRREIPDARAHVDDLQRELAALKKEAVPLSKAEETRLVQEDIAKALPDEEWQKAAKQFIGREREQEVPAVAGWIIREGGIKDFKGEVRAIIGRGKPSRLINGNGRTLDSFGERMYEIAPWAFPDGRPLASEVLEFVRDAANGRQPWWWREYALGREGVERMERIADRRDTLAAIAEDLGIDAPKSLRGVAEMLQTHAGELPAVLARLEEKAVAGGDAVGAAASLEIRKQTLADLRDYAARAVADKQKANRAAVVKGATAAESGVAATRNRGRLELLQDRYDTQQKIGDVYAETIALLEKRRLEIRGKIENELKDWKGNSSAEGLTALEKREQALQTRQAAMAEGTYKGRGERLAGADKAVDKVVRRVLNSEQELSRADLEARANEITDRVLGGPDGRLNYEDGGTPRMGAPTAPMTGEAPPRGSAHTRDDPIPTALIADFVEKDVDHVISSFLRTALPDIELTKRFGDVEMTDVFRGINEDFARKTAEVGNNPKELQRLEKQRLRTIEDVAAIRDKVRNVYGWSGTSGGQMAGRIANAARNLNVATDLGTSTANSMGDLAGIVFRYGFQKVYKDGWEPWFKGMAGMSEAGPALKRQFKAATISVETHLNLRAHALSDITEAYRPGSQFERALSWGANKSQILNLQATFTDFSKNIASSVAQAEILRAAERVVKNTATQDDITKLAAASIDRNTAAKIHAEFSTPGGGDVIDGVRLPNTEVWKDRAAAGAFERALSREADIAVVTPGMEKPLWMSTPVAGLLGQFKSFIAATHERTLIAQLQQRDANTLQGLIGAVAMGMLSYRLYTLASGKPASDKPEEWIKEGISRSGVMGWFDEINSITAKATGGKGDVFRLIGAEKELSRYQSRSILSSLLGPSASKIEGVAGITRSLATGEGSAADIAAGRRLIPLQNHFAIRRLLNEVEDGMAHTMGIEPADRTPRQ